MESTINNIKIQNKNEIRIPAGIMPIKDGKIKPDTSKGEIKIFQQDGLLQFQWTNLDKNISDDPLVIFSGEWEWAKIPSNKGRVYVLKSKCFEEEQFYFWMQSPNKELDIENEFLLNKIFEAGNFECLRNNNGDEIIDKNEITGINNYEQTQNSNANNNFNDSNMNKNQNGKAISNQDFIKNIANTFKNIKRIIIKIQIFDFFRKIIFLILQIFY